MNAHLSASKPLSHLSRYLNASVRGRITIFNKEIRDVRMATTFNPLALPV